MMIGHIIIEAAAVAIVVGLYWWGFGPRKDKR